MENKEPVNKKVVTMSLDNITKVLTALIAAAGFIWGIVKFQSEQRTNESLEFRRKLWEKKLETYSRLSEVTGELIIQRHDTAALDSLHNRFEFLYYSAMVIVEDSLVEKSMVQFSTAIRDYKDGRKSELHLKSKALALMREISTSLKKKQELFFDHE